MAISTASSLGAPIVHGSVVVPVSVRGQWTTIISNVEASAETTALLEPLSATSSYIVPLRVGAGTRLCIRMAYTAGATVVTDPVVRLYAVYGEPSSGVFADDGTIHAERIDSFDANDAGITVTSATGSQLVDTTYEYTNTQPGVDDGSAGYDLKGAWYVIALIETAASITAGTGVLQAKLLN